MEEPTKRAVLVMCGSLNENAKKEELKAKSASKNQNKEVKKVINNQTIWQHFDKRRRVQEGKREGK